MLVPAKTMAGDRSATPQALRTGAALAAIVVAGAMVALLIVWSGLDMATLVERLSRSPAWLFAAIAALAIAQAVFSAMKWRLVLRAYENGHDQLPSFRFCLHYSVVSALVAQFVPVFIATSLVRGFGARRLGKLRLGRGVASSAFEQAFDVLVLLVLAGATLVVWLTAGSPVLWMASVTAGLFIGYGGLLALNRLRRLPLGLQRGPAPWRRCLAPLDDHFAAALFNGRLSFCLLTLSLLRYATMMARAPLIVMAMGFALPVMDVAQGFTLVQATQLAAVTPGNLGLQEWSWTAVLALRGAMLQLGTEFALTLRVLTLLAANAGLGLLLAGLLLRPESRA